MITNTILVCDWMTTVLFDLGSTYSYVSIQFALRFDAVCDVLNAPMHVSTPVGESIIATHVYNVCPILFMGFQTWDDLIILDMTDFNIILSMTCLSLYYVVLNCNAKSVTLEISGKEKLEWEGAYKPMPAKAENPSIESFLVVSEFNEVFPTDFPGMPLDRDIDFCINLESGTRPISIPPYRMALAELRELKAQIQELFHKAFIRPSAFLDVVGLTNAATTFMSLMNDVFKPFLDSFVIVFIDDILVYSKSKEEHTDHLRIIFIFLKNKSCMPNFPSLFGAGLNEGVMVDPQKIEAVKNWVRPRYVTEVRNFVWFASYYFRFVKNFASIVTHLTRLTKKEVPFEWDDKCEVIFQKLKTLLSVECKDFIVYCDASHLGLGAMSMQERNVIAYESR
ncbi:hypothetical protein MTR67_007526 [Solanum verrucosum]|uniref:Reverse transcriptase domain-containing protein n=1 Tax=Solanum verrucosum TaxID=315347 RepID=A0AAF0Q598_SOLVR|nr:hypothetical protein MTR67_007526 [Solanum verrucosum]